MSKFTQGEWIINGRGNVTDEDELYIAVIPFRKESEANTRAIKAVPEMYKALQELVPILESDGRLSIAYSIKKLLARIDGED